MELLSIDPTHAEGTGEPGAGWTAERKVRFLARLAECGDVRASAAACHLSPQSAYKLRRRDALFARAWRAAVLLARDHSEQILASRAIDGVEEAIYYRGELVGTRRRYDTRLLLAHLGRLDRQAEAASRDAGADAGRFDELLACVAGETAPDDLAGEGDCLPPALEDYAAAQAQATVERMRAELPHARDKAGQAQRRAAIDDAVRGAVHQAQATWGVWFAGACETVDRIVAGAPSFRARTVSTVSTAGLAAAEAMRAGAG